MVVIKALLTNCGKRFYISLSGKSLFFSKKGKWGSVPIIDKSIIGLVEKVLDAFKQQGFEAIA
jgi:hypothetical protein